jgi:hypothetical protein
VAVATPAAGVTGAAVEVVVAIGAVEVAIGAVAVAAVIGNIV